MQDLHLHTTFSDGADSVEDMVRAAIAKGMDCVGVSDHSFTSFDPEYCAGMQDIASYRQAVAAAAAQYADQITVLCGIEQDFCCGKAERGFDFAIGSVHYVEVPVEQGSAAGGHISSDGSRCFVSVDETPELFEQACEACFDGDYYAFAQVYYKNVAQVLDVTGAQYVGHFDLFSKYNGPGDGSASGTYFDEQDPRYVAAWRQAADALLAQGATFEVNTAALRNGRRAVPYPAPQIQEYLQSHGATLVPHSDAHCAADVGE